MPVIGAMPAKIALHAGMLMFAARMNMHSIDAALDPSQPTSIVTPAVGAYLGLDVANPGGQHPHRILIGIDHGEIPLRSAKVGPEAPPNGMIIGSDLLREAPLLLDFSRQRLRLPERSEARHLEAQMTALPVSVAADGCLSIEATDETGQAVRVALVGWQVDTAGTRTVHLGDTTVSMERAPPGICTGENGVIGWSAFENRRLLFDLAANTLWISHD